MLASSRVAASQDNTPDPGDEAPLQKVQGHGARRVTGTRDSGCRFPRPSLGADAFLSSDVLALTWEHTSLPWVSVLGVSQTHTSPVQSALLFRVAIGGIHFITPKRNQGSTSTRGHPLFPFSRAPGLLPGCSIPRVFHWHGRAASEAFCDQLRSPSTVFSKLLCMAACVWWSDTSQGINRPHHLYPLICFDLVWLL